jgi:hypothetical protein
MALIKSFPNPLRVDQSIVIWSQHEIYPELRKFQPDILHTHDPLNLGLTALRAARKVNASTIFTIHQLPWFNSTYLSGNQRIKQIVERSIWRYSQWFMQQCEGLITPSQKIANIVEAFTGYLPQVINNGVDLHMLSLEPSHSVKATELCDNFSSVRMRLLFFM